MLNGNISSVSSASSQVLDSTTDLNVDSPTFFIDKSADRIGMGTIEPAAPLHLLNSTTDHLLIIESTDDGGGSAPDVVLYRNSASPIPDDILGVIYFNGEDDGGNETTYASMHATIVDETGGTEDGKFEIRTLTNGTNTGKLFLDEVGNVRMAALQVGTDQSFVPTELLTIRGGSNPKILILNTQEDDAGIKFADNEAVAAQHFEILFNSDSQDLRIKSDAVDNILYFEHTGNIGIGTAAPTDKMHIYEASGITSCRVESLSLADTEVSRFLAKGRKSGGDDNYAEIGVVYNDSPTDGTDQAAGFLRVDESSGLSSYVWFSDDDVFRIGADQNMVGSTEGTSTGHDYSDERLKDISSDAFPYGLDTINSLTPIKYKWKKDPDLGDRFGFGAQTVQSIIPELISESSFLLDNGEKKLVMEYRMMHSILVKAIQELSAKVTALENA